MPKSIYDLATPALLVDADAFQHNLDTMSAALPGARLRPHVKAHKCSAIAARQAAAGHRGFTCATALEVRGLAAAGLGEDLLLANELVDSVALVTEIGPPGPVIMTSSMPIVEISMAESSVYVIVKA